MHLYAIYAVQHQFFKDSKAWMSQNNFFKSNTGRKTLLFNLM